MPAEIAAEVQQPEDGEIFLEYDDIVRCPNGEIGIVRGLGTEMDDDYDLNEDEVAVEFVFTGAEKVYTYDQLRLIERNVYEGLNVCSVQNPARHGTVINVDKRLDVESLKTGELKTGVSTYNCYHPLEFSNYHGIVLYQNNFYGFIKDVVSRVRVAYPDGTIVVLRRSDDVIRSSILPSSSGAALYVGQPIVVPPSLLVTAVYLRGGYRERLAAARGVVQDVLPIFLRVDWVGAIDGRPFPIDVVPARSVVSLQRPEYNHSFELGEVVLLHNSPIHDYHIDRKSCEVVRIVNANTSAIVAWNDGQTEFVNSTSLASYIPGDLEFLPLTLVERLTSADRGVVTHTRADAVAVRWLEGERKNVTEDVPVIALRRNTYQFTPNHLVGITDTELVRTALAQQFVKDRENTACPVSGGKATTNVKSSELYMDKKSETAMSASPSSDLAADADLPLLEPAFLGSFIGLRGSDAIVAVTDEIGSVWTEVTVPFSTLVGYDSDTETYDVVDAHFEEEEQDDTTREIRERLIDEINEDDGRENENEESRDVEHIEHNELEDDSSCDYEALLRAAISDKDSYKRAYEALPHFDYLPRYEGTDERSGLSPSGYRRLRRDCRALETLNDPDLFVKAYEESTDVISLLIFGATETPYENVAFRFAFFFGKDYPQHPPRGRFFSNCARMHPNLYENGKICLSLLGTWSGSGLENWSEAATLQQLFLSLQALLINEKEPYYLEAGFEELRDKPETKPQSKLYSERATLLGYQSIITTLSSIPQEFSAEITAYYRLHADDIIERARKQMNDPEAMGLSQGFAETMRDLFPSLEEVLEKIKQ